MNAKHLIAGCLMVAAYACSAFALNLSQVNLDYEGDERKGQYLFRKYCRTACHEGANGVRELSPDSHTMDAWKAFGSKMDALPCAAKWSKELTGDHLNDIFTYLHGGAKDSPTPTK